MTPHAAIPDTAGSVDRAGTAGPPSPAGPGLVLAAVVVVVAVLHHLGSGPLAAPHLGSIAEVQRWLEARDATTVGIATVRLGALVVGYHLLATSALAVLGRALRRPALVRWADTATLPPLRPSLRRLAGLGLSGAAVLATPLPSAGASPSPDASLVVLERIDEPGAEAEGSATLRLVPEHRAPAGEATLRVVPPHPPTVTTPAEPPPVTAAEVAPPTVAPPMVAPPSADALPVDPAPLDPRAQAPAPDEPGPSEPVPPPGPAEPAVDRAHRVRAGDHLWLIAEARLHEGLGRAPTDAETGAYWRRLVRANPQLGDADLLFPGDLVQVPPILLG